jgi:hypothetical protein
VIFASSNILGIAVNDRSITVAQVTGKGDRLSVKKTATFTLPAELSLDKPQELGAALGSFIKHHGFSGSEAVIGVPARWLIAVDKEVPPSGREQMRALLRLQAERLPLADAGELVFDYVGEHNTSAVSRLLLVAMLKKQLNRLEQTADAAGLRVAAITPTSLALASVVSGRTGAAASNTSFLMLAGNSAELVYQRAGTPRLLRHVPVGTVNGHGAPALAALGTELKRSVTMARGGSAGDSSEMVLWDGMGLEDEQVAELSERSGMRVRAGKGLSMLGVQTPGGRIAGEDGDPDQFAPALALALVGSNPTLIPFDFTRSRLAPPPVRRFGTKTIWAGIAGALLVIALATLFVGNRILQNTLDKITTERSSIASEVSSAKELQAKVDFTNSYFDNRTPMLECLRDISLTLKDEDPFWATNVTLKEVNDVKVPINTIDGTMEGKGSNMSAAFDFAKRLLDNPRFTNVKGPQISPGSGRQGGQATFTITFRYEYK